MSLNEVNLIGNLGKDPEIRHTAQGKTIANFSLATSEKWKDKQTGEPKEKTEWHRVSVFGPLADVVSNYVKKGSKLYIKGKLQTRKWQNQQGQDQYTTEIVLQGFDCKLEMLNKVDGGQQQAPQQQAAPAPQYQAQPQMAPQHQPQHQPQAAPAPQAQAPQSWGTPPAQGQQQAQPAFNDDLPPF